MMDAIEKYCINPFQIPVGYIWTPVAGAVPGATVTFQIPVGYIWTLVNEGVATEVTEFQIPVGYIWTDQKEQLIR